MVIEVSEYNRSYSWFMDNYRWVRQWDSEIAFQNRVTEKKKLITRLMMIVSIQY
jgi:hypothetical protein